MTVSEELYGRLQRIRDQRGFYYLTETLIAVVDFYDLLHEYLDSLAESYQLSKLQS